MPRNASQVAAAPSLAELTVARRSRALGRSSPLSVFVAAMGGCGGRFAAAEMAPVKLASASSV